MNLLCLSDPHGDFSMFQPKKFPACDIILIAGDITEFGMRAERQTIDKAAEWLSQCGRVAPTYWIPGNHDILIKEHTFGDIDGVECVLDRTVYLDGYTLHGVSMSPAYLAPDMVHQYDYMTYNEEVEEAAYSFGQTDIILSHCPPYGILDEWGDQCHIGSESLLRYIKRHYPALVICGHVHDKAGFCQIDHTMVYNVSQTSHLVEL